MFFFSDGRTKTIVADVRDAPLEEILMYTIITNKEFIYKGIIYRPYTHLNDRYRKNITYWVSDDETSTRHVFVQKRYDSQHDTAKDNNISSLLKKTMPKIKLLFVENYYQYNYSYHRFFSTDVSSVWKLPVLQTSHRRNEVLKVIVSAVSFLLGRGYYYVDIKLSQLLVDDLSEQHISVVLGDLSCVKSGCIVGPVTYPGPNYTTIKKVNISDVYWSLFITILSLYGFSTKNYTSPPKSREWTRIERDMLVTIAEHDVNLLELIDVNPSHLSFCRNVLEDNVDINDVQLLNH